MNIKDINGYEGIYMVSDEGTIYRVTKNGLRALKPHIRNGYPSVMLSKNGEAVHVYIHRCVAQAFIENPDGYTYVNHKDENRLNANVDNLEWCTNKYNLNYGTTRERMSISGKKKWKDPIYREKMLPNARTMVLRRWCDVE